MSKLKMLVVIPLVVFALTSLATAKRVPVDVRICHKGKDMIVSGGALRAHLRHGDWLGSCERGGPKPSPLP